MQREITDDYGCGKINNDPALGILAAGDKERIVSVTRIVEFIGKAKDVYRQLDLSLSAGTHEINCTVKLVIGVASVTDNPPVPE